MNKYIRIENDMSIRLMKKVSHNDVQNVYDAECNILKAKISKDNILEIFILEPDINNKRLIWKKL